MKRRAPQEEAFPDEATLEAWESMRIEVLHELQEGAIADVPDSDLDQIGELVVVLRSLRTRKKLRLPEMYTRPKNALKNELKNALMKIAN
jgi:hypothetical protein